MYDLKCPDRDVHSVYILYDQQYAMVCVCVFIYQIPARYLSSDLSAGEESAVYNSLALRDPTTKLLYVTPEKVLSLSHTHSLTHSLSTAKSKQ